MAVQLKQNAFGKSSIRLTKVKREGDRHDLMEMVVNTRLEGDFTAAHLAGDNQNILPTDTQKNTVYAMARNHPMDSIEAFAISLARHFVEECGPHISRATVQIEQSQWNRILGNAFQSAGNECGTTEVIASKDRFSVRSGVGGILVLKTTDSAFTGFQRDQFTTLKDAQDRIFATTISADWDYISPTATDFSLCRSTIRKALVETFATHRSLSVQQTLYEMGSRAFRDCDAISEIRLSLPNSHRLLVDLEPFHLDNPNMIFTPTAEPFGLIEATLSRAPD